MMKKNFIKFKRALFNLNEKGLSTSSSKGTKYIIIQKPFDNLKKIIHYLCSILIVLLIIFLLIIITILSKDEDLSLPLMRTVISEIIKDIFYIDRFYCKGENPVSEAPKSDSGLSNEVSSIPDAIPCPCCGESKANNEGPCKCLSGSGSHLLDPPFKGMDGDTRSVDRYCCNYGNAFNGKICFACECILCTECSPSHFHSKSQ